MGFSLESFTCMASAVAWMSLATIIVWNNARAAYYVAWRALDSSRNLKIVKVYFCQLIIGLTFQSQGSPRITSSAPQFIMWRITS